MLLKVNNEWMLHNMKMVVFKFVEMEDLVRNTPHKTKIILQKLLYNTNCTFYMACLKDFTAFFSDINFKINDKKGVSLLLDSYYNQESTLYLEEKQSNICQKVTKLHIKHNSMLSMDTIDLFQNVTQLEICDTEFFDFKHDLQQNQTFEPKFNLSNFPKLKHLSLLFIHIYVSQNCKTSAIDIPKQIERLKMDQIYCHKNDGLPIVIQNDSLLHTMEIYVSIGNDYTEIEFKHFVEILNLCNKLNHFKCLKINVDLHFKHFSEVMQDPINSKRIEKWKHNEKRTIIVTFMIPDNDSSLSIEYKMQVLFKQLFANDVKLICETKTTKYPQKWVHEPSRTSSSSTNWY